MNYHNADIRKNEPDWLIHQAKVLIEIGKEKQNSSSFIYSCLEARISLEVSDLYIILGSVSENHRLELLEKSKKHRGIPKINRQVGALKEKYQDFILACYEVAEIKNNYYDFKKSKSLQKKLSQYIHSYHFIQADLDFYSQKIQKIPLLIEETHNFLLSSFDQGNGNYEMRCLDLSKLDHKDTMLLARWKDDQKMTYEQLVEELRRNSKTRD